MLVISLENSISVVHVLRLLTSLLFLSSGDWIQIEILFQTGLVFISFACLLCFCSFCWSKLWLSTTELPFSECALKSYCKLKLLTTHIANWIQLPRLIQEKLSLRGNIIYIELHYFRYNSLFKIGQADGKIYILVWEHCTFNSSKAVML